MEELEGQKSQLPEKLSFEWYATHLTPLEHTMVGSSVTDPTSKRKIGIREILAKGPQFYLKPLGLEEGKPEKLVEQRNGKYIEGHFVIFELPPEFLLGGYIHRLLLSLPEENGLISLPFRIQILKDNPITDEPTEVPREELSILKDKIGLRKKVEDIFVVNTKGFEEKGEFMLSVKLPQQI